MIIKVRSFLSLFLFLSLSLSPLEKEDTKRIYVWKKTLYSCGGGEEDTREIFNSMFRVLVSLSLSFFFPVHFSLNNTTLKRPLWIDKNGKNGIKNKD